MASMRTDVESLERLELLSSVASWYYESGLDQHQIADRIGRSRSMVSRLLTEAREAGVIEIRVRFPLRRERDLEDRLQETFGLTGCQVLAGSTLPYGDLLRRLGQLAARSLETRLHSEVRVAVGWGAALHATVAALPEIRLDDAMVIQVMGSVGDGDPHVDGPDLARELAFRLNGDFRFLASPLYVDSAPVATSLLADRTIARTLDLARRSDVMVTGVGAIDHSLSGIVRAGHITEEHSRDLKDRGVVGDVLGFLMRDDGSIAEIEENERVVSLHPSQMADIPTVIGVAGGIEKAVAIGAALRAGYFDVLVTDEEAAVGILELVED
ncbi:MAG: hypothetical protein GEU79_15105 [Acidimicrobiia bacterium]|nr:hypothetical protein [Acidimicrobiia bacterium]